MQQLTKILSYIVTLIFVACFVSGERPPQDWVPDEAFSQFLQIAVQNFKTILKNGDRSLRIPKMDPLYFPNTDIDHTKRNARVNGTFQNMVLTGISDMEFRRLLGGFRPPLLDIEIYIPNLQLSGNYNINGLVASIFPLYGNGPFTLSIRGLKISGLGMLSLDGDRYEVESIKLDGDVENIIIKFDNFMGGGSFGRVLNNVLKMVGKRLFDTKIKGELIKRQEEVLKTKLNQRLQESNYGELMGVLNDSIET